MGHARFATATDKSTIDLFRVGIEQIAGPTVPTIDVLQEALSAHPSTAETVVLSLSVDRQNCRSRVDLQDAGDSTNPATLALMAAQILRRSFGGAFGALRVDVYRCVPGSCETVALVATHGDYATDRTRRSA